MSRTLWRGTIRRFAGVIALAMVLPILPIGMQAASARTPAANVGLTLNGTTQYGTAGSETDGTYSNLGASQFTLETWIRRTGSGATTSTGAGGLENTGGNDRTAVPLISKGRAQSDGSNVDMNFFLGLDQDNTTSTNYRLVADFEDSATGLNHPVFNTSGTLIPLNTWTHVAATYDGSNWRLYVNGNLDIGPISGGGATPRFDSIQRFAIGSALDSNGVAAGFFQGSMDEVRVWDAARTQAQIRASMNDEVLAAPNLIGHWGLNENSGAAAANSGSASSNANLSLVASPTWGSGFRGALQFTGVNTQTFKLGPGGTSPVFPSTALRLSTFTLETWFRRTGQGDLTTTSAAGGGGLQNAVALIAKGRGDAEGDETRDINYFMGIELVSGVPKLAVDFEEAASTANPSQNHALVGGTTITDNVWHHAAATYDGGVLRLYLDGVPEATSSSPINRPPASGSSQVVNIGSASVMSNAIDGVFQGSIDETRIWNSARSAAQIHASFGDEITTATGLVGRWGMNESTGSTTVDSAGTNNGFLAGSPSWVAGFTGPTNVAPMIDSVSIDQPTPETDDSLSVTVGSSDANDDAVNYQYQWRKNGADIVGATNATLDLASAGNGDPGDQISVRVTGHDGFSFSAPVTSTAVTVITSNTEPTADISLDDASPRTNDSITATAVGSDGQNDPLTYTYVWKVEGVTQQTTSNVASATDTFDLSTSNHGNRGEQVTVTVTANDGSLTSTPTASSTATATVANTPPVVDSVTIDQSSPNTDDVLSATITSSDADGDSRTYSYQWLKNGNPISGEMNATLDLGVAGNGSTGDQLSLRVGANDGTDDSALVTSSAVTVGDAAPVVDSVTIDQSSPDTDDVLSVTVDASDDDGDTLTYDYQWTNGGVDLPGETGDTLDLDVSGNGDRGDDIAVRVTASDAGSTSDAVTSDAVTVANSTPVVASVTIDQSTIHTNGTLTATVTGQDIDGDGLGIDYQWLANGSPVVGATDSSLDLSLAGNGDAGDVIRVRATVDDGDLTSAPATSDAITVANSAPSATVELSDDAPATGDTLTATATVDDDDTADTVSLTYVWKVNDTTVRTTGPTTDLTDTLDLSVAGNGDNGDTVTVTVTPNDGSEDGDAVTDTASVGNQAPVVDSVTITNTLRTFTIATSSVTAHDADGDTLDYDYQWIKNGVDITGETGDTLDLGVAGNGDRGDQISVRVTASDGVATSAAVTSPVKFVMDSPGAVSFVFTPIDHLYTDDVLNFSASHGDPDGDPTPTITYEWRVNGVAVQSTDSLANTPAANFDLGAAGHGDIGQTVAMYYAVNGGTMTFLLSAVVENSAPSVDGATIDPSSPRTNDSLTVVASSSDADGDPVVYDYQWIKNASDLTGETGSTLDLSVSGNGDKGDQISVRLTPDDGSDGGSAFTTDPVTIVNTAPTATVALSDSGPGTDDTLIATASRNDDDGDPVLLTYVWKVDGVTKQTTSNVASLSDSFDLSVAGNGDNGQTVTVTATPNDGTEDGAPDTDTATVGNAAPVITSATIDETAPRTNDTIHVSVVASDDDGDTVTYTYQWTNDGANIVGQTGSSLDLSLPGNGGKNHVMAVKVTAHDGNGGTSSEFTALGVTIANTPPSATVSLNTATPSTNQTLTATATKSDADAEAITLTYVWKVNGVTKQTTTKTGLTDTFDLSVAGNGSKGDAISVTVTPDDSDALGTPVSASATVENTAPVVTAVAIDQASALTNDTLTTSVSTSDPDGDSVAVTYQWLKNGNPIVGQTGSSLDLSLANNGTRGDIIRVRATADDGQTTSSILSATVTIGNSVPTATVSLAPTTPFTNDTLTATATKADADGNAVTLTYVWKVNGVTVKTTSASNALTDTLDLSQPGNGDPGQQVTVTVTPNDGTDPGSPVVSNTATVSTVNGTPTASGSNFAITKDAGRSITLKATDPEGDTLAYTIVTPPAHGSLSVGTGGTRTFTPTAGYSGADSFTFRVSDGSTNSGLATVNLTVAPKYKITITDSAFSPIASKPVQGGTVRFVNSGTAARTITDTSGMGLFGASINPGAEYAFRFTAAGKYEYSCSCSGSTGRVAIPVKILPAVGGTSVVRTVNWAVEDPAAGYVFDIQIKRPGIPGWTNWRTGVTTLSDAFTPDAGNGTYKFKARLRNTANNTHSLYSAAKAVSVS